MFDYLIKKKQAAVYNVADITLAIDGYTVLYHKANIQGLIDILKKYTKLVGAASFSEIDSVVAGLLKLQVNLNSLHELKLRLFEGEIHGKVQPNKSIKFHCSADEITGLFNLCQIATGFDIVLANMKQMKNTISRDLANKNKIFYSHSPYRHRIQLNVVLMGFLLGLMFWSMLTAIVSQQRYTPYNLLSLALDLILNFMVCAYLDNMNERNNFNNDLTQLNVMINEMNSILTNAKLNVTYRLTKAEYPHAILSNKQITLKPPSPILLTRQQKTEEARKALAQSRNTRMPLY